MLREADLIWLFISFFKILIAPETIKESWFTSWDCNVVCPLDAFDYKTKRIDYKKCEMCHWCIAAEICKKKKLKERSKFYPKGFLEFFGGKSGRV